MKIAAATKMRLHDHRVRTIEIKKGGPIAVVILVEAVFDDGRGTAVPDIVHGF